MYMYVSSIRGGSLFCRSNLLGYLRYWTRKGIQRVIGTFNLIYESLFSLLVIVIYWPGGNRREERKGWSMLAKIAGRLGTIFPPKEKQSWESIESFSLFSFHFRRASRSYLYNCATRNVSLKARLWRSTRRVRQEGEECGTIDISTRR